MSKYRKLNNYEGVDIDREDGLLRFACCDCGLVHTMAFVVEGATFEPLRRAVLWRGLAILTSGHGTIAGPLSKFENTRVHRPSSAHDFNASDTRGVVPKRPFSTFTS